MHIAIFLLVSLTVTAFACSSQRNAAPPDAELSQSATITRIGRYLESRDGPEVLLWDDVGAPAFFPQTCAEFVGFDSEERSRTVQIEEDGSHLLTVLNPIEGQLDEVFRWRLESGTAEITSLQEPC